MDMGIYLIPLQDGQLSIGDNIELEVTDLGESRQDRGEGLPLSSPPL